MSARAGLCALLAAASMAAAAPVRAEQLAGGSLVQADTMPAPLAAVGVDEHLGQPLPLDLPVRLEDGSTAALGSLLQGDVPTLFTLNYYTCETLCSVQLNAVLKGLQGLDWTAGEQFRVVTLSIDPSEGAELARTKKATYLESLGRGDAVDWRFLTADEATVRAVADAVGFRYAFDAATRQYAHPAVITFLDPKGSVARYLYGVEYPPMDLKFALMEAAAGRVGSPVEKLILSCFRYDHAVGRYTPWAFGVMRLGGVLTVLAMSGLGIVLWRRELRAGTADRSQTR
jgi:protein SCO1/2